MDKKLLCPVCKAAVCWNEDYPHRPFCSKRCQQIDFGDWATESHVIPVSSSLTDELPDDFDEFSLDDMGIPPEGEKLH